MTFADLVPGSSVFLDANVFVYHFEPHPILGPPCNGLVQLASHDADFDCVSGLTRYAPV